MAYGWGVREQHARCARDLRLVDANFELFQVPIDLIVPIK
jgi:hypothetical protein